MTTVKSEVWSSRGTGTEFGDNGVYWKNYSCHGQTHTRSVKKRVQVLLSDPVCQDLWREESDHIAEMGVSFCMFQRGVGGSLTAQSLQPGSDSQVRPWERGEQQDGWSPVCIPFDVNSLAIWEILAPINLFPGDSQTSLEGAFLYLCSGERVATGIVACAAAGF